MQIDRIEKVLQLGCQSSINDQKENVDLNPKQYDNPINI